MHTKRDLQLVRLACKRRWITAEEGEDALFLKRKFGNKLSIDEIMRRRGYLDPEALAELARVVDNVGARRAGGGGAAPHETPKPRRTVPSPAPAKPSREASPPPVEAERPARSVWERAKSRSGAASELGEADKTLYQPRVPLPSETDAPLPSSAERTVVSRLPEALAEAFREGRPPPASEEIDEGPSEPTILAFHWRPPEPGVPCDDAKLKHSPFLEGLPGTEVPEQPALARRASSAPRTNLRTEEPESFDDAMGAISLIASEEAAEILIGDFGPYGVHRVIALGEGSAVYLAKRSSDGLAVALKVLDGPQDKTLAMLEARGDELVRAAKIDSPNVVRVLDVGREAGRYYVALEYVDGWSLEERLAAGDRLSLLDALALARDVARGLAAAGAQGLVHGAVSPEDILLEASGRARLGGFGLSRELPPGAFGAERPVRGRVGFMAPEQIAGGTRDPRSDLFGLGLVLYGLLAGKAPFDEEGQRLQQRLLKEDLPDLRTVAPSVPDPVRAIVARLVARPADARFARASDAADALDRAIVELQTTGVEAEEPETPLALQPIIVKSVALAVGVASTSVALPLALGTGEAASWTPATATLHTAFLGAAGLLFATLLLSIIALIRRGEIPLPMSSAWLVRVQEGLGAAGAIVLVAGFALAPPAWMNLVVSSIAVVVLASILFGVLLRRAVARARSDGGIGRVLAVLGHATLSRWRALHAPLVTSLACLATVRFAVLAYFSATGVTP